MPDETLGGAAAADSGPAGLDAASQSATGESSGQQQPDDYSDLSGDPRVQKYVSDLHSKALKDIPKEYRDAKKFQELLGHSRSLQELQQNPGFQAFVAGQRAASGGQPQQPKQGGGLRELLSSSNLAKTFKVDDRGLDLFSEFGDILSKNLVEQMVKEHISPIREYLAKQNIDSEYGEASKLEGFQEALPKIQQILQQYGNQISFHDAYKLARFDELTANQKKAVEQAMGGEEEIEGAEKLQRAKAGERPSGRGTDGVSLKKPKNRSEARGNAARKLASMGVDVTGE